MSLDTTKRIVSVRYNDADIPVGAALPELTNPAFAYDVAEGKEFIDGAGDKKTGTLSECKAGEVSPTGTVLGPDSDHPPMHDGAYLWMYMKQFADKTWRNGSFIRTTMLAEELGNATAADVASGKTFTSAAGLKVTGTMTVPLIRYFNGRVDAQQAGGAVVFNIPVSLIGTGTIKIYGNINYGASATIAFSNNGSQNKAFANARSADASTAYSSALGQLSISYPTDLYGVSGGVDCNFVVIEI